MVEIYMILSITRVLINILIDSMCIQILVKYACFEMVIDKK